MEWFYPGTVAPGPWPLALGSLAPGPRLPGPWPLALGSLAPGPWCAVRGTRPSAPWCVVPGARPLVRGARPQGLGLHVKLSGCM